MEQPGLPGAETNEEIKKETNKKYKTLYLLHGYGGNQDDWLTSSNIRALADQYGIAVVMPSGENSFYVDGPAAGTRWGEMVGKELVEFTRRMFLLSDKREDTFIGGLSMGGFGAARLGSYYPGTFGKIFSLSGAFIVDDIAGKKEGYTDGVGDYYYYCHTFGDLKQVKDSAKDPFWCMKQAVNSDHHINMYMACGEDDFLVEQNRHFTDQLGTLDMELEYLETPGIHDWKFWNEQLEPAIRWLLK